MSVHTVAFIFVILDISPCYERAVHSSIRERKRKAESASCYLSCL